MEYQEGDIKSKFLTQLMQLAIATRKQNFENILSFIGKLNPNQY